MYMSSLKQPIKIQGLRILLHDWPHKADFSNTLRLFAS